MIHVMFKCNACEDGPCYYQADKLYRQDDTGFGDDCLTVPKACPIGEKAQWEYLSEGESLDYTYCENLKEWLNCEGWDNCPEEIRQMILTFGIERTCGVDLYKARQIFQIMLEYDDYVYSTAELQEMLKKYTKAEILAGLLPEAFRAGIIWREKYLQEHKK